MSNLRISLPPADGKGNARLDGKFHSMGNPPRKRRTQAQELAAEIIRRVASANAKTGGGYVVRLSDPPTSAERLQPIAAHLERRPIVILPHKCNGVEEWLQRHGTRFE
jgi:hypothetical protein